MTRRLAWTAALAGLLVGPAALAQRTAGPGQEKLLGKEDTIGPDALRRMAEQLKALQGGKLDPRLLEDIAKLKSQYPGLSNEDLARRLLREHPELQDPRQARALDEWLRQVRGPQIGPLGQPRENLQPIQPQLNQPQQQPANAQGPNDQPGRTPPPPPPDGGGPGGQPHDTGGPAQPGQPIPADRDGNLDIPEGMAERFREFQPAENGPSFEQLARRRQQFEAVAAWWEKNVGKLDDTPAVRDLLLEMFTGKSVSGAYGGSLGELLDGPAGEGFGKLADRLGESGWKLPDLGIGKGWGGGDRSGFTPPEAPSSGSSSFGFGGVGGGAGSWLPVVAFLVVAAVGLVLWWLWPKLTAKRADGPRPLPGLGPWPVDPRAIADREALVKAFEYLSVLLCGAGARVWNHVTIAAALERAVPHAEALADPLARLYAVARYTPADEPLPPAAIAEAREYLCELAGVSAA
jgi:hypothetical protein